MNIDKQHSFAIYPLSFILINSPWSGAHYVASVFMRRDDTTANSTATGEALPSGLYTLTRS